MTLSPGTRLGPYEVLAPLGAGGMGEVYRARDARLDREVAIKVLPSAFSQDAERLRRFEQEARAAGRLNHPNILVVHDLGTQDGSPYIVSDWLEGEELRARSQHEALPVRQSLDYAKQIARGLSAAHEQGMRSVRYGLVSAVIVLTFYLLALAQRPARIITFNDDGAWSWFEDERAIVHDGKLIIGSVASGAHDESRRGDIEVVTYEVATGKRTLSELHDQLLTARGAYDDHNSPALLVRPDGRILAVYSMHGPENRFYYRISTNPGDPTRWQPERTFTPSESSRITYSNLHYLSRENSGKGRIYNFYRGFNDSFKPSYAYSDDWGETWVAGRVLIAVPGQFRHRPYVKYASNGVDTVHIFYTEGHPRNFDNSAYHVFYRDGRLHQSDGTVIGSLAEGLKDPGEGTRIFRGDAHNVAWVSDVQLDAGGRPYVAYSVQKNSAGLPPGQGGEDHRYRYARWTGKGWADWEIAYAGSRLYAGEDDYTGNLALDPNDPHTVYISTNADPVSGEPLLSRSDRRRHYEIFKGTTGDGGKTWRWAAVTRDSTSDNIRPLVPPWDGKNVALIWLRGRYTTYTNYDLDVVGIITH